MVLFKIQELDPEYRQIFDECDVKNLDIYSDVSGERIGKISDLVIDESGHFRYLIVDLKTGKVNKQTLMPIGRIQLDSKGRYGYALGFTDEEAENLPSLNQSPGIDRNFELQVRRVYRGEKTGPVASAAGYRAASVNTAVKVVVNRDARTSEQSELSFYLQEPALYQVSEYKHAVLCRCEERLLAKQQSRRSNRHDVIITRRNEPD